MTEPSSPAAAPQTPASGVSSQPAGGSPLPIPARVSTGRARLAIEPLGVIAYDGLTLPSVSPGGQWVASQVGQVASGDAEARSILQARVIIAPVASAGVAPRVIERAMLNRSVTSTGALIRVFSRDVDTAASMQSMDLAVASWADGALVTIATGVERAEHAILLRDGTLVMLAGEGDDQRVLFLKHGSDGQSARVEVAIPRRTLAWPLATPDQRFVGVLAWSSSGAEAQASQMELVIIATPSDSVPTPAIVRRVPLSMIGSDAAARSAVASIDATPIVLAADGWRSVFVLLHIGLRRMVAIDAATGKTAQFAPGSLAAAMMAQGVLVAENERLMWQPSTSVRAWPGLENATRAIEKPCIPRATSGDEAILLAPGVSTGVSLQLLRMRVGADVGETGPGTRP